LAVKAAYKILILQKIETGASLELRLTIKLQRTSELWMVARRFRNGDASPFFSNGWSFEQRNRLDCRLWAWPERRVRVDASARLQTGPVVHGSALRFATVRGDLKGLWMPKSKGGKHRRHCADERRQDSRNIAF